MNTEIKKISLMKLADGQKGIIITILGGSNASKRLADLGLTPGSEISVIGRAMFSGPVRVEAGGSRLVIGRGLASKIIVELK
jgi:ferrous iron transport protein A